MGWATIVRFELGVLQTASDITRFKFSVSAIPSIITTLEFGVLEIFQPPSKELDSLELTLHQHKWLKYSEWIRKSGAIIQIAKLKSSVEKSGLLTPFCGVGVIPKISSREKAACLESAGERGRNT